MKVYTMHLGKWLSFRFTIREVLLLTVYLLFCYMMLAIVLQYIPMGTDTAFLGIKQDYVQLPVYLPAFYIHVFTAILALPAGFTQFSRYIQKHYKAFHRWNGRVYVFSILLLGAPSGFIIGICANGGVASQIAFCLLAVLWFYFTLMALLKARSKKFIAHKKFMYRSFALTLSAITLRAWKYLIIAVLHPHPMDVYRIVAWLGWVLNLLIAEYIIFKTIKK